MDKNWNFRLTMKNKLLRYIYTNIFIFVYFENSYTYDTVYWRFLISNLKKLPVTVLPFNIIEYIIEYLINQTFNSKVKLINLVDKV